MNTFICDASKLCWQIYEKNPHDVGALMLYLNLEHNFEKIDILESNTKDEGMEL